MNSRRVRYLFVLVALLPVSVANADTTAFINVNVLPMTDDTVVPARTVVVVDDRIATIGPVESTVVPDEAVLVDGTDRFLMPGLTEMHGHVTSTRPADLDRLLGLFLANGVTTVRGMLGRPSHLTLRADLAAGRVLGPRLITSGPSFNGNSVSSPAQAEAMVREQHAAGYDFLKIHPGLTRAEFSAMADTASELGIRFAGHVPADVGVPAALAAGIATIDHLDGYMESLIPVHDDPTGGIGGFFGLHLAGVADASRIEAIAQATVAAGTGTVATESLFEHTANHVPPEGMAELPEMRFADPADLAAWTQIKRNLHADPQFDRAVADRAIELRRALILALHRAGPDLMLLGSDSPQRFNIPGFALHRELGFLVAAGLSPYEALRSGTVNPARFFDELTDRGTLEVGKIADLVMLDENPLDNIGNSRRVHGTMLRGVWLSRQKLDELLHLAAPE